MDRRERRDQKLIAHNMIQVEKFFEHRDPTIMKNTAGSFFSNESDRKSESKVTLSERGHQSLDDPDNDHFRKHVYLPIISKLPGTKIYVPAEILEHDPSALREWRKAETEHQKKMLKKFRNLCKFVASRLERKEPGLRVFWVVRPEDEEARAKTRQAAGQERTWNKYHSYRLIGAEVQKVIEEEGCGVEAAKGLVSQRDNKELGTPCSFPRVEKAWLYYKKEQQGERESA